MNYLIMLDELEKWDDISGSIVSKIETLLRKDTYNIFSTIIRTFYIFIKIKRQNYIYLQFRDYKN
jgi:hypothetical protein